MQKTKKVYLPARQGSILAYSLIILAMMVAIVATMSIATVIEKKSASSTDFSVQAYQTADSGVQLAIKKINKKRAAGEDSDPITSIYSNCSNTNSDGNIVTGDSYKLSFFKDEAGTIDAPCSGPISDVKNIKSVGTYKDTVRAVQVAVAASGEITCETGVRHGFSGLIAAVSGNITTFDSYGTVNTDWGIKCASGYTRTGCSISDTTQTDTDSKMKGNDTCATDDEEVKADIFIVCCK